ncbi:chorismate mutase [Fibrobacter sp. UWEL]|uniref:chorismate mutase n=1 Tax=Fibrobacter sp. UWEL TaxID=1896209 RepID=UPI00090FC4D0|nr:chorismate mutase [Fibrobacter sp. UWEL]SHL05476.1 chorismate mutase [Fibrobacter sp. UWEL]
MKIDDWRIRIDELNEELIALLNKRATFATEIGKIKKELGLPVLDQAREDAVLEKVGSMTKGPLSSDSIKEIFRTIMAETRKVED